MFHHPGYRKQHSCYPSSSELSLSQKVLRYRVCLVVDAQEPKRTRDGPVTSSWVCCHFTCKDGNTFPSASFRIPIDLPRRIDNHLLIFDCCFPLSKHNDPLLELDTEIHFTSDSLCKIRGCGVRLFEAFPSLNLRVIVWKGDASKFNSVLGKKTEQHGEETERSRKRIKIT
ncbi:unnamed protein product [Microthlaspi erraticum]|uniref:Uncharacterized protein n=1 Tax=Microthlaspi erraticum TaxID=1685480 RepID=A0A6D2J6E6_9BRAS|nr:unnamed protein product [Microthlaspi erraticum]